MNGNGIGNLLILHNLTLQRDHMTLQCHVLFFCALKGSEGAAKGQDNQEHEECRAAWAAWPGRDAGME